MLDFINFIHENIIIRSYNSLVLKVVLVKVYIFILHFEIDIFD